MPAATRSAAALRAGHGFPGDAERLDAELAEQLLRRVPVDRLDGLDQVDRVGSVVDLVAVAEIAAAYRVLPAADPETADAVDQAVADLLERQGAERPTATRTTTALVRRSRWSPAAPPSAPGKSAPARSWRRCVPNLNAGPGSAARSVPSPRAAGRSSCTPPGSR